MATSLGALGRTQTTFGGAALTAAGRQNADLTNELEKVKLQQAIARAQAGQTTATDPNLAAKLASQLQLQAAQGVTNKDLQTQRLQTGSADLGTKLAAQMAQLQANQSGNRTLQSDRIGSTEKINTQNLAAQLQRQGVDIQGKKDLTTLGTDEELRKRKNAATNALALFNAAPGKLGTLNPQAAAAQLA